MPRQVTTSNLQDIIQTLYIGIAIITPYVGIAEADGACGAFFSIQIRVRSITIRVRGPINPDLLQSETVSIQWSLWVRGQLTVQSGLGSQNASPLPSVHQRWY